MKHALTYDQLMALPAYQREMERGAALWRSSPKQARRCYANANAIYRANKQGLGVA